MSGELIYSGRPSHKAFAGEYLLYVILSLVIIGIPLLISRYLKTISESWAISERRIEYARGILSKRVDSIELWRIKDVAYSQTLLDRMLGEGTITIVSGDISHPSMSIRGLPNSKDLFLKVRDAVERNRRSNTTLLAS